MNILFLSPLFPPNAHAFCRALQGRGATVLGIGDEPAAPHSAELAALTEYVCEPRMAEYEALSASMRALVRRHGRVHRLDSNGEHWLEAEGKLRDDFEVVGLSHAQVLALRSKLAMGRVFRGAGIAYPATAEAGLPDQVRGLALEHGYPLVFKPDSGSGSVDTFVVQGEAQLSAALEQSRSRHIVQPFVRGDIVTFDGLTDSSGRIVFFTSHAYDAGIMQVREGQLDGHYYSLRSVPAELERVGRLAVSAFDIRERFFHVEFFAQHDGSYVGLEMNVRPPGGYTTDMMGAACDIDVYDLWAAVVTQSSLEGFSYSRAYHTAHAGRRRAHSYRLSPELLARELGETLFAVRSVPDAYAATMGNVAYLLRSQDLTVLRDAIALVQART